MEDDQRLRYTVEEYFHRRGTYPMLLSFRKPVDEDVLDDVQHRLFQTFRDLDGVEVICTEQTHGQFWTGVLIELSDSEHTDDPNDMGLMSMPALEQSVHPIAMDIHRDICDELGDDHARTIGFSCGNSVYSASTLQSLGVEYFQRDARPTIR